MLLLWLSIFILFSFLIIYFNIYLLQCIFWYRKMRKFPLVGQTKCIPVCFHTRIYQLSMTSADTSDSTLNLKREKFSGNDIERFEKDVRFNGLNLIIINGRPYSISFDRSDDFHMRFAIRDMCATTLFPLVNCHQRAHVKTMLSGFILVLGFAL